MKCVIKDVNVVDKDNMEYRLFYMAYYNNDTDDVYVVVRLGYDMQHYKDVVMFISDKTGNVTYGNYLYFQNNYTIIRPVNSVTFE